MPSDATYRDCPACTADRAIRQVAYSPEPWRVVECQACGFVYLQNPPEYEALKDEFAFEKTSVERAEVRQRKSALSRANRWVRAQMGTNKHRWGPKDYVTWFGAGRVLDVGCGDGHALDAPITPYGIELSDALFAKADERMRRLGGYCIHAPGAEGIWEFEENFFDGVLMNSYLEHETQVQKTLEGARRALKPGGKVFIRVPNYGSLNRQIMGARWCGFRWPDHVNYFTLSSLRDIAGRLGFDLSLVNKLTLPVDDNVQVLLAKT